MKLLHGIRCQKVSHRFTYRHPAAPLAALSELCAPVSSASDSQHLKSASTGLLQVLRVPTVIGRKSFAVARLSLWNGLAAAAGRPKMTRQLKAYLLHIWCVDEHSTPSDAMCLWCRRRLRNCRLTCLLTYAYHWNKPCNIARILNRVRINNIGTNNRVSRIESTSAESPNNTTSDCCRTRTRNIKIS